MSVPYTASYAPAPQAGIYDPYATADASQSLVSDLQPKQEAYARPSPVRKYSKQWLSVGWNRHVHHGWLPRLLYVSTGIIVMVIWIGIIIAFARSDSKLQTENSLRDARTFTGVANFLFYKALLRNFNPDTGTLTVQWSMVRLNDDNTTFSAYPTPEYLPYPVGLYRDLQAIQSQELTSFVNDKDGALFYKLDNATATLPLGVLGVHTYDAVDTDIDMAAAYERGSILKEPVFGYPLEEWSGSIVLVVTDLELQKSYANFTSSEIDNSNFAFTLLGVNLVGSVLNWKIESSSDFSADCADNSTTCLLTINFTAKRSGIVKFVVIVVVIVNWLTTIVIFLITGETILLRRSYILEGTDFLGVCFAGLFALPTVRSILPGAPTQFGAIIDMIGILPNIVVVSLCTMGYAIARLRASIKEADSDREKLS